ncbi:MAG: hypothetical protein II923_04115 [Campylobacter sp.]|nr:hypothetical protein [Campylobacter sp.]
MAEEKEEQTLEEIIEDQARELNEMRQDLNVLASAFKQMSSQTTKFVNGMNKDMLKAQQDITKCLVELDSKQKKSASSDYMGLLLSDDLKERERQIIDQVKQIVNLQSKQTTEPKRKKFLGIF